MRLSLAVTLLVASLSSCSRISAFGTPAHQSTRTRTSTTTTISPDAKRNVAFYRGAIIRGGTAGPCPSRALQASSSLLSEEGVVLEANLDLLSERGRAAITNLMEHDTDGAQAHVYANWPDPGTDDEGKRLLAEQVRACVAACWCCGFCAEKRTHSQMNAHIIWSFG